MIPRRLSRKESIFQYRNLKRHRFSLRSGRSPGVGNGNPLQCSCLEDSLDRGVWRATVYWVTKRWAQLTTQRIQDVSYAICFFSHLYKYFNSKWINSNTSWILILTLSKIITWNTHFLWQSTESMTAKYQREILVPTKWA